jgi:hypothetical protein
MRFTLACAVWCDLGSNDLKTQPADSWVPIVTLWATVQAAHVALRYAALSRLRFATLNQKRACALAAAHAAAVAGAAGDGPDVVPLPGVDEANAAEPMLVPAGSVRPRMQLGCSLQQAWGAALGSSSGSSGGGGGGGVSGGLLTGVDDALLSQWVELFEGEPYLLVFREGVAWVVVKQGASSRDLLRAVWQAAWLDRRQPPGGQHTLADSMTHLRESLAAARLHHAGFLASLSAAGWDLAAPPVLQLQQTRLMVERG